MQKLHYSIVVTAPVETVWKMLTEREYYDQWATAFSANSTFRGEWRVGARIDFIDPAMGGTRAEIESCTRPEQIQVRHVALISKDGAVDTESDMSRKWIGITESYLLTGHDGATELRVEVESHPDFVEMFESMWPVGLKRLKEVAEAGSEQ